MSNPFTNKMHGVESKNVGPFLAFGEDWFAKYQDWLLLALNMPVLRLWARWIFRIHRDCKYSDIIVQIQPNNYKVLLPDGQIRGDFRTHPKFSKRVYFAFRWWWWCLHYLDEFFAMREVEFSFGFDTLTAYPDAHTETNSVDGYVGVAASIEFNYSDLIDYTGALRAASASASEGNYISLSTYTTENKFTANFKIITLFYTPFSGTVTNAVYSIRHYINVRNLGDVNIHVAGANPNSNTDLVIGDYNQIIRTSYGYKLQSTISTSAYSDITLNTDGKSNCVNGVSKFSYIQEWDLNKTFTGTWAASKSTSLYITLADYSGTTADPKLVVTYSTSSIGKVCGVAYSSISKCNGVAKASIKKICGIA